MNNLFLFTALLFSLHSFGQPKYGSDRVELSYVAQKYIDSKGVRFDGLSPDNTIIPQNPKSHYFALQYERTTRYGLIVGVGVEYGIRRYDVSVKQDLTNFDPDATANLKNQFFTMPIVTSVNYWSPKLLVGYRKPLGNKWTASVKVGVSEKYLYTGLWDKGNGFIRYYTDDLTEIRTVQVVYYETRIGREARLAHKQFPRRIDGCEFYLGIERKIDRFYIKNISLGVEASKNLWRWDNSDGEMTFWSNNAYPLTPNMSKDIFYDHNLSVGLRVGISFGKAIQTGPKHNPFIVKRRHNPLIIKRKHK